jgi:hypothetical protein
MTDLAVHDGPILAFTMVRNSQVVKEKKPSDPDEDYLFKPAPKKEDWKDPFAQ